MTLSDRAFRNLVAEALEDVPPEFRPYLENVEIVVEDWPSRELLADLEVPEDEALYGVYSGTPLTERAFDFAGLPDRITLFREELRMDFPEPADLRREVRLTVLHEIAHHFGIGEDRLEELGLG